MLTTDITKILADSLWSASLKLVGVVFLAGALAMIYKIIEKKILSYIDRKKTQISVELQELKDKASEPEDSSIYQAAHGAWSPTGWVYDRDTKKWDPPEYLAEEAREKWRWDEEKRIWIDIEKEKRLERYRQWRKEQGKEPTYEEWKAQRQKELQEKSE